MGNLTLIWHSIISTCDERPNLVSLINETSITDTDQKIRFLGLGALLLIIRSQWLRIDGRLDASGQVECLSSAVVVKKDHARVFAGHVLVNRDNVDVCGAKSF